MAQWPPFWISVITYYTLLILVDFTRWRLLLHITYVIGSCLMLHRGGGRSQKLRRHGGYWPQDACGSQQRGCSPAHGGRPCWRKVREGVAPHATAVRGCRPGRILKLQMRSPAFWCIFSPVPWDLHPWMEAMRSLRITRNRENYGTSENWGLRWTGA